MTTDPALALLSEILAELRLLRETIEAARPARTLRHQDRVVLAKILPVVAAHYTGTFSTWELIDAAKQNDALAANLRLVIGQRTAREMGQLLSRATDIEIDGYIVRRVGTDANGALWQVVGNTLPLRGGIGEGKL